MKKTLVIGASENPSRYSSMAIERLKHHQHDVVALGRKPGEMMDTPILTGTPAVPDVHTVALYLAPQNQPPLYDYILGLKPKRVIFPPGTENPPFQQLLEKNGVKAEEGCTMVMLATGQY